MTQREGLESSSKTCWIRRDKRQGYFALPLFIFSTAGPAFCDFITDNLPPSGYDKNTKETKEDKTMSAVHINKENYQEVLKLKKQMFTMKRFLTHTSMTTYHLEYFIHQSDS